MASPTMTLLSQDSKATVSKATKTTKGEDLDMIVLVSSEIENLTAEEALTQAAELNHESSYNAFKLGGVLAAIQTNGWHEHAGYESFGELVEDRFGFKYRKAAYLINIYLGLVESKVSWDKVKHLGWSKLIYLAPVISQENAEEWIARAEKLTVKGLQDYIKSLDSDEGPKKPVEPSMTTTMSFKLHVDQKETVEAALEKAQKGTGSEYKAVALEMICLDFLQGGKAKAAKTPAPTQYVKELDEASLLKLMALLATQYPTEYAQHAPAQEGVTIDADLAFPASLKQAIDGKELMEVMEVISEQFPDADISIAL